ncbi:MAG: hypothetical protein V4858_22575 [Pseudomonadota bacterium]
MFPWLWFWAPHIHLPWSGNVEQQIKPELDWFFEAIRAGDSDVERKAVVDVASYGQQLGLISEALLGLSGHGAVSPAQANVALDRLEKIRIEIEAIKQKKAAASVATLSAQLEALRHCQPAAFEQLAQKFRINAP